MWRAKEPPGGSVRSIMMVMTAGERLGILLLGGVSGGGGGVVSGAGASVAGVGAADVGVAGGGSRA